MVYRRPRFVGEGRYNDLRSCIDRTLGPDEPCDWVVGKLIMSVKHMDGYKFQRYEGAK